MRPSLVFDTENGFQRAAAVSAQGHLLDLWIEKAEPDVLSPGAILYGQVVERFPALKSVLVECGEAGRVQLRDREVPPDDRGFLVQVTAAAQRSALSGNDKHARASAELTFAGRNLIYMPYAADKVRASKRADGPDLEALSALLGQHKGGWIVRRQAAAATLDGLTAEAAALVAQAAALMRDQYEPGLIAAAPNLAHRAILEAPFSTMDADVMTEGDVALALWQTATEALGLDKAAQAYNDAKTGLFESLDVPARIAALANPLVSFKEGRAMIQHTEAMAVIDLDLARKSALDAVLTGIVAQCRLRNISGAVVVDLPDWVDTRQVSKRAGQQFSAHPQSVAVHGVSRGGLLELAIPRRYPMLHEIYTFPEA